jgi:hypothetical protein
MAEKHQFEVRTVTQYTANTDVLTSNAIHYLAGEIFFKHLTKERIG